MSNREMSFEIGTDGLNGLVVGYDGSERSRDALAFAAGMARRNGARLTVVHVPHAGGIGLGALSPASGEVLVMNAQVEALIADVASVLADYGVNADLIVSSGRTEHVLEDVAEERHADAIVVGHSQETGRRSASSVPSRLLRITERPVMVIP